MGRQTLADVTVFWPSGQRRILAGVATNQKIAVREPGLSPIDSAFVAGQSHELDFLLAGARVENIGAPAAYLRPAGSLVPFTEVPLVSIAGLFLRGTVPDSLTTAAGLEYWVEYALGTGSRRRMPFEGAAAPLFLPANFERLGPPEPVRRGASHAVRVPVRDGGHGRASRADVTARRVRSRCSGGPGDGTRTPGSTANVTDSTFAVGTGDGFWIVSRSPVTPEAGGRTSDPRGVSIEIQPGWNQVAHPYLFPVALADVDFSRAPSVQRRAVGFRGGYREESVLEPWHGYWMYNLSIGTQDDRHSRNPRIGGRVRGAARGASASVGSGGRGRSGRGVGPRERRGEWRTTARDGPGPEDAAEPPEAPGGSVRVWFEQGGDLTRDVRRTGRDGHVWELRVRAPAGEPAQLRFDGVTGLPPALGTWRSCPKRRTRFVDLRANQELTVPAGVTRRFRLAAGTPSFVADVRDGVVLPPAELSLGLAWPNPFTATTQVGFALTRRGPVEAAVYDVAGRRVRTLVSQPLPPGRHRVEWEGTDAVGRPVASGVYFLRLDAEDRALSRKVRCSGADAPPASG